MKKIEERIKNLELKLSEEKEWLKRSGSEIKCSKCRQEYRLKPLYQFFKGRAEGIEQTLGTIKKVLNEKD